MSKFLLLATLMVVGSRVMAENLPVPPIPPMVPPLADAAPVPNVDAKAPVAPVSEEPSLNVRMYRASGSDPAAGFVPGSRYQTTEDRKPIQTPGLSINVPLK